MTTFGALSGRQSLEATEKISATVAFRSLASSVHGPDVAYLTRASDPSNVPHPFGANR
jgi:hypothetical protein